MKTKFTTIILGKRSYISNALGSSILNSKVLTIKKFIGGRHNYRKYNLIINNSYPLKKLENLHDYKTYFYKSLNEIVDLLNFIKNKKNINKIILSSSASVYSSYLKNIKKDSNNRQLYSSTKILVESLLNNFCLKKNINLYILRIFNVYGQNEKFSVISRLINLKKNKNLRLNVYNSGRSKRDFIYIKDLVKIYYCFLNYNFSSGIYDVGSGKNISVKNIIKFLRLSKKQLKYKREKVMEIKNSVADIKYLKRFRIKLNFTSLENFINNL